MSSSHAMNITAERMKSHTPRIAVFAFIPLEYHPRPPTVKGKFKESLILTGQA